jgi:hypothetical protein
MDDDRQAKQQVLHANHAVFSGELVKLLMIV